MPRRPRAPGRPPRRGVATVELALLLPLLGFLLVAAVDYGRISYHATTLTGCARNGALHGRRSSYDPVSPYASLQAAALADATNLTPAPTITSGTETVDGIAFVTVTATYPFRTFARYPGIPNSILLTRTVRMPIAPRSPRT